MNQDFINIASFVFWTSVQNNSILATKNSVLKKDFSNIWSLELLPVLLIKLNIETDTSNHFSIFNEVNDLMYNSVSNEFSIIGGLYPEDYEKCIIPEFNEFHTLNVLRKVYNDNLISDTNFERVGTLILRSPLPSVVYTNQKNIPSIFIINNTINALGFEVDLIFIKDDIIEFPENPHNVKYCITGTFLIQNFKNTDYFWLSLLPNSNVAKKIVINSDYEHLDLVSNIYTRIKNYRLNEGIQLSEKSIINWVNQFDIDKRKNILLELQNIFQKRYFSKNDVETFLKEKIIYLTNHFEYNSVGDFLNNSVFLNLQQDNKSQSILLNILKKILMSEFSFDFNQLGSQSFENYIYLDDILCSGNTLYNNIKEWVSEKEILDGLESKNNRLVFLYIISHTKNYLKKIKQLEYRIHPNFEEFITLISHTNIDNRSNGAMEILKPLEDEQPQIVLNYKNKIEELANNKAIQGNYKPYLNDFYRTSDIPTEELFFTDTENRKIFENTLLEKGIEILSSVNASIPNMRALGYSLPSSKDFGFGALAFFWRSVPNNTPLVFWYESADFTPLFYRKSTWIK